MRKLAPLVALLALAPDVACSSSSEPPPAGRARYGGPSLVTIGTADAKVTLHLDRFSLSVANGAGKTILEGLDTAVAGDDGAYGGTVAATRHETTFRASLVEGWDHVDGKDSPWRAGLYVARADVGTDRASLDLFDPAEESVTLHLDVKVTGADVTLDLAVDGGPNQVGAAFKLPDDEHFFGLGERNVTVDHRGRRYECWTEEGGIAVGEKAPPGPANPGPNGPGMTHVPIPFFYSNKGYALYLDTTYRNGFALGDTKSVFRFWGENTKLRAHVFVHDDPKASLADYTALTGRATLPAPWVFGPRRRVDHGAKIDGLDEFEALRTHQVPTTAVDDATHFLPNGSDVDREPELRDWTTKLHALGFKAIGYYNAYVSITSPKAKDLVAYGRKNDLFVRVSAEEGGGEFDTFMISGGGQQVATIDMSKPAAVEWYGTLMQKALDIGYDGWMLDFGEYLPQKAVLANGMTGWEAHNAFPLLYQKATTDYLRKARGEDWMYFARAGYAGTQKYAPIVWSGDPAASFDDAKGLPAQVRAGINSGLSGLPYWGSDIGGYSCNADPPGDKEVLLRWVQFGALSSDMHDENACAGAVEGTPPKWTIWRDAESTEVYGRYARLHTRLFPYLYATAKEATETGMPVIRHPFLVHPTEKDALAVELEYYFGPSLYVAPVVRRGATTRTFWLPPGRWVDWWSLAEATGGAKVTRDAPLDVLPLYLRSGGVVAMLDPTIETLAPATRPEVVTLEKVAGVLDVRAVIDAKTGKGTAKLVDGTAFTVSRTGADAVVLPASLTAATEAELGACSACGRVDALPGGAFRVRWNGASATSGEPAGSGLSLAHASAPKAVRIRWDVVVLP